MNMSQVGSWLHAKALSLMARASNRRGQNTVEYLLMLTVIVGVALIAGRYLKNYMPELLTKVTNMISNAAE